jgi:hypothetical protein
VLKVTEDIRLSMEDGHWTGHGAAILVHGGAWDVAVQSAKCPELFGWCWYGSYLGERA